MQLINVACGGTLLQHLPERFGHHEHRRVVGLLRRRRPRRDPDRGLAGSARCGRARPRHQVTPPPGRRPARRGPDRERHLDARRAAGGDRAGRRRLRARRAMAPRGRRRQLGRRGAPRRGHRGPRRRSSATAPTYTPRPVRLSKAIRATAWGMVVAGIAAPLVRKRVNAPPVLLQSVAFGAPLGLCVAVPRSRGPRHSDLCAADVGLPRRVQVPARRPRGAGRHGCTSTTRSSPTACSA